MADLPECPSNREEQYLADLAGLTSDVPPCPNSRKEAYYEAIGGRLDDIEEDIEEIKNNPDVADIVATYADLEAYDTSKLTDKDIIRVLQDETHDGASTFYRYSKSSDSFTYIGEVGDYQTKTQTNTLLADKQDKLTAGANIAISSENVISAVDTTYADFIGATEEEPGVHGLVPAPEYGPNSILFSDGTCKGILDGSNISIGYYDTFIELSAVDTTYTAGTNITIDNNNNNAINGVPTMTSSEWTALWAQKGENRE